MALLCMLKHYIGFPKVFNPRKTVFTKPHIDVSPCLYIVKRFQATISFLSSARSPLFSHISETIQGLATIRACERQKASVAYFHAYQDEQSKGWHTYIAASRWFAVRVDLISSFFIGIVAVSGVAAAGGMSAQNNSCYSTHIF